MNTELARTFLEIVATGSFVRAAERLHIGQTTVSARVRALEQQLGRPLFVRGKNGVTLTPAGEQFLRYAPTFVQLWQRARHQVAVPPGHQALLTIGGEVSLWQPLLLNWVIEMRRAHPGVALRVNVDVPQDLVNQVAAGLVDVAIMYAPQHRPGLAIDLLMEEELVLATTAPDACYPDAADYVEVDWRPGFSLHHEMNIAEPTPGVSANLGPLALSYVLAVGGAGYFRLHAIRPHLESQRLRLVPDAPRFSYPVYAVYSANADSETLNAALDVLHTASARSRADAAPHARRD